MFDILILNVKYYIFIQTKLKSILLSLLFYLNKIGNFHKILHS